MPWERTPPRPILNAFPPKQNQIQLIWTPFSMLGGVRPKNPYLFQHSFWEDVRVGRWGEASSTKYTETVLDRALHSLTDITLLRGSRVPGVLNSNGLRKPIARSTDTRVGTSRLFRAPAALAPPCRRGGVYSGGGRERGGRVKSRRREGCRLRQGVRPRHDGGGAHATRNAQGTSGRSGGRNQGSSRK